jgi:hypothetical protein
MRRMGMTFLLVLGALAMTVGQAAAHRVVAVLDDCDPSDPAWEAIGGCTLKHGEVTLEEFNELLSSPLSQSTVGHPAWRNYPTYLLSKPETTVHVINLGGRLHTFTEVAAFGGGRVPGLNIGLTLTPECVAPETVDPTELPPGGHLHLRDLTAGDHLFQCCIHPWMRALIKVKEHEGY